MSAGNNAVCNDGRNSTSRRTVPGGLPVRPLGAEEPVDTYRLPPGGFWFAPGTIESTPASEPLNGLEKSLLAMVGAGIVAFVLGVGYGWWKGLL